MQKRTIAAALYRTTDIRLAHKILVPVEEESSSCGYSGVVYGCFPVTRKQR